MLRQSAPNPTAKGLVAAVRSAGHMKSIPAHTPLSTVMSQFKEAEEAWAHEKVRCHHPPTHPAATPAATPAMPR